MILVTDQSENTVLALLLVKPVSTTKEMLAVGIFLPVLTDCKILGRGNAFYFAEHPGKIKCIGISDRTCHLINGKLAFAQQAACFVDPEF